MDQVFRYENGAVILAQGNRSLMTQFPSLLSINKTHEHDYNVSIQAINISGDPDTISSDTDTSLRLTGNRYNITSLETTDSFEYIYYHPISGCLEVLFQRKFQNEIANEAGLNYSTDFIFYPTNNDSNICLKFLNGSNQKYHNQYRLFISESVVSAEIGTRNSLNYTVDNLPVADFMYNESHAILPVQFTDQSQNVTGWIWDFGDGTNSTEQNPVHVYSTAGNYTVKLVVSNAHGTVSKNIIISVLKSIPTIKWDNPDDIIYGTPLDSTQLNANASVNGTLVYTPIAGTILSASMDQQLQVDFTPIDTANYTNATANVTIKVLQATPPINWSNPEDITYGTALNSTQLNASASVPGIFNYNPVPETVLGAKNQTLNVTFTPTDTTNYTNVSKSVSINVRSATPEINWSSPADIVYGTPLNSTQLNASASVTGNFTYNPVPGTVLSAENQTLNATFTPTDTANYSNVSKNVTIKILQITPEINWSNLADIVYGTPLNSTQLNASASVTGNFTYNPVPGTVLNATTHTLHVDFTPTDALNYTNVSKSVSINVQSATPEINWSNPADIVYGTALNETQLNASASVPGIFNYNPVPETILGAKNQTLNVTFTPTDTTNYTNVSKSVSINVRSATPEINWSSPADIVYGTPLNSTQLNASASVTGNFTYNPVPGTVLSAKNQNLNVTFTPIDTANYSNISKNVSINVLQATPAIIWNNPAAIIYGTALSSNQLNAVATNPVTGNNITGAFEYKPVLGTVLSAGTQTLHSDFTPADAANYTIASKTATINVLKAYAYITNYGSDTVSVIDTATNTVTTNVPVGSWPKGVAVDPTGTSAYVANYASNTVSVIDTATNTVTTNVPVGSWPYGVAVNPTGTKVYVANEGSNTVSVINTTTNTVTTVPVGKWPYGVAVNPTRNKGICDERGQQHCLCN